MESTRNSKTILRVKQLLHNIFLPRHDGLVFNFNIKETPNEKYVITLLLDGTDQEQEWELEDEIVTLLRTIGIKNNQILFKHIVYGDDGWDYSEEINESTNNKIHLSEASKLDVLTNKLGLSNANAEKLDSLCGSLSVWMANKLIDAQMKILKSWDDKNPYSKSDIINKMNTNNFVLAKSEYIQSIMDWIRVGLNGNIQKIKELSFDELYSASEEWHEKLDIKGGDINYNEENLVVIDFRDDFDYGFYWADLETNDSEEECRRMGHCGRTAYGNTLFSLRENKKLNNKFDINTSHLTASIGRDGTLYQLKGPKNSKPKDEYHDLILPLFTTKVIDDEYLINGFGSEYASDRDFKLSDLPKESLSELYQLRPELFDKRSLKRKLGELGIIELPDVDYSFELNISPDDIGDFVDGDFVLSKRKVKEKTPAGTVYEKTVEVRLFETIMAGETWELWDNYDTDWESAIKYNLDNKSETRLWNIVQKLANINEIDIEGLDLEDAISEVDTDYNIRNAISSALNNAEADSYSNYLIKNLKESLEELGHIVKFDDTGVTLKLDFRTFMDNVNDEMLDEYFDDCGDDNFECVFKELSNRGYIDKPRFSIDDRWYPDINENYFNDELNYRLDDEYER